MIDEVINGTIKVSEFISDGFDKGQGKSKVCTVLSVALTLSAGTVAWFVWRDSVKKKNKENEINKQRRKSQ